MQTGQADHHRGLRPYRRRQRADPILEPEGQEQQAHGARIPRLRQLPTPPASRRRPNPQQPPDITDANRATPVWWRRARNPNTRRGLADRIRVTRDRHPYRRGDRERADYQRASTRSDRHRCPGRTCGRNTGSPLISRHSVVPGPSCDGPDGRCPVRTSRHRSGGATSFAPHSSISASCN